MSAPDQSPQAARTPEEALAAIRALCEQSLLFRFREEDVLAILDSVTPAQPLDRVQALKAAEEGLFDYRRRRRDSHRRGVPAVSMKDEYDTWVDRHGTEVEAIVDAVLAVLRPSVQPTRAEIEQHMGVDW